MESIMIELEEKRREASNRQRIVSHKDLRIWQQSMNLVTDVYKLTKPFPHEEIYGITSQIRRASVAIPANISEGFQRNHIKEYIQFLYIAKSSASELETLLEIATRLGFLNSTDSQKIIKADVEILKMLGSLITKLKGKIKSSFSLSP